MTTTSDQAPETSIGSIETELVATMRELLALVEGRIGHAPQGYLWGAVRAIALNQEPPPPPRRRTWGSRLFGSLDN